MEYLFTQSSTIDEEHIHQSLRIFFALVHNCTFLGTLLAKQFTLGDRSIDTNIDFLGILQMVRTTLLHIQQMQGQGMKEQRFQEFKKFVTHLGYLSIFFFFYCIAKIKIRPLSGAAWYTILLPPFLSNKFTFHFPAQTLPLLSFYHLG